MPAINLQAIIKAPQQRVFDLSRSVQMHIDSTSHTGEKVVNGRTTGLFELNDTVTWRAKHFGLWQNMTVQITEMQPYSYFADEMVRGPFHSFRHEHRFMVIDDTTTRMEDVFTYRSPLGILGQLADILFLQRYMTALLVTRNELIKVYADGEKWREVI